MNFKAHFKLWIILLRKKKWKLHFIDFWWRASRNESMIKILKETLYEDNIKDFPLVIIYTGDRPINKYYDINIFSFTTSKWFFDRIIPDFTYDQWPECKIPEFNKFVEQIEIAWNENPSIKKIWWIRNLKTSPSRIALDNLWKKYTEYLDIKDSNKTKYISLPDLIKEYQYLIDVEWNWYSWRLKYLFYSGRPVFVQKRIRSEYALQRAVPYKDFIPVNNDFSDLIGKIEKYYNSNEIEKIWKNWQKYAIKHLNKDTAYKYIRHEFLNLKKIPFNYIKVYLFVVLLILKQIYNKLYNLVK